MADEIVLGHYASMTGSEATFGRSTDNGIKLAVDEINEAGGVNGKKVRVITYDDKGEAARSGHRGDAARHEGRRRRGAGRSGVEPVAGRRAGVPGERRADGLAVVDESEGDASRRHDLPRLLHRSVSRIRVCEVCPRARRTEGRRRRRSCSIRRQPYAVGLQDEFAKAFVQQGGEDRCQRKPIRGGDQDFSAQLTAIRASEPDVIFIPGYYTDVGNIAIQARKLGIKVPLLGGDGWDSAKLGEIGGDAINGCFYSNHYSHQDPNPRVQEFIKKYKERVQGNARRPGGLGYDAARIVCEAMGRAKSLKGADIAAELAKTKDFDGVTGKISIDADRNAVKPAVMLEMKDGVPTYVTTIEPRAEACSGSK